MDNMKEVDIEELNKISGGELAPEVILIVKTYMKMYKGMGYTLEQALQMFNNPEVRAYVRAHWGKI